MHSRMAVDQASKGDEPALQGEDANAVTTIVDRIPRPGEDDELERAIRALNAAAARCPGYVGVTVTKPSLPTQPGFRIIYRFDTVEHLAAWEGSEARQRLLAEANRHTLGEARFDQATGLEAWFTPAPRRPPSAQRAKIALVTWIGIFPLVGGFAALADAILPAGTHPALALGIVTMLVVLAMSYVVGPFLTRLFRRWLHPR